MAYQSIGLGTSADDGTGDSLRVGGDKINDNFSEIYTLLGTGSALTTGLSTTASVVTLSSAVGTFTTLTPAVSDGTALGSASLEFSDLFLADASTIQFGADQDVILTHVADTGLLLNAAMKIQFRDAAIHISSTADGDLSIAADDEIDLTSTLIDINGNVEISGTLAQADTVTMATNKKIQFRDTAIHISSTADGDLSIAADDEIDLTSTLIDINGNVEISGTATTTGVHTFTAVPVFPNNTVESADIQADAITGAKIADDAINSEHYTDGSIDTAHIADNQVTLAKMAGGTDGNIISYDASGDPVAIATGSDGQVLTSTGAGSPPAFEAVPPEFASGTVMVFHQTNAPTGWTKNTTAALNDGALRTTTGTVGTGGSVAFETAFASQAVAGTNGNTAATTIATSTLPAHTHVAPAVVLWYGGTKSGAPTLFEGTTVAANSGSPSSTYYGPNTASTGGGGSHVHGGSTFSGTAIDLNVKFYDVIVAAKD